VAKKYFCEVHSKEVVKGH